MNAATPTSFASSAKRRELTPWRDRVSELQVEIALALGGRFSPLDAERQRRLLHAQKGAARAALTRGFAGLTEHVRLQRIDSDGLLRKRQLWYALHAMRTGARLRATEHNKLRRGAAALRSMQQRRGWNSWHAQAVAVGTKRTRLRLAVGTWRGCSVRHAWLQWGQAVGIRRMMVGAVAGWRSQLVRRAVNQWAAAVESDGVFRQRVLRALSAMVPELKDMRRAFLSLVGASELALRQRRSTAGWLDRERLRAFNSWIAYADARARVMTMLRRGAMAMLSYGRRRAYSSWTAYASERALVMAMLRRGAMAMVSYDFRRAYRTWAEHALAVETAYMRAVSVFDPSMRLMRRVLNTLRSSIDERQLRRRALAGFLDAKRLQALNSWRAFTSVRSQRVAMMRHVLVSTLEYTSAKAYRTWVCFAGEHAQAVTLIRRGAAALVDRDSRRAFWSWVMAAECALRAGEQLGTAIGEWRGSSLRSAWQAFAAASGRRRTMMGAVAGWRSQLVRRAVNQWAAAVESDGVFRQRVLRALSAMVPELKDMRRAFLSLVGASELALRQRRSTAGWLDRERLRAFNSWIAYADARARVMTMLRRGAMAMLSYGRRRAYSSWTAYASERALVMAMLRRGAMAMVSYDFRRAYRTWAEHALAVETAYMRAVSVFDPSMRLMRRVLNTLRSSIDERQLRRRALAGFLDAKRLQALNSWRAFTSVRSQRVAMMRHVLVSTLEYTSAKAYRTWVCFAGEHAQAVTLIRRGAAALFARGLRVALTTWIAYADHILDSTHRARVALGEWRGASFRRAFFTWADAHLRHTALRSAAMSLRHRHVRRAINHWIAFAQGELDWRRHARQALMYAIDAAEHERRRCWTWWRTATSRGVRGARSRTKALRVHREHKRLLSMRQAFVPWARAVRRSSATNSNFVASREAAVGTEPVLMEDSNIQNALVAVREPQTTSPNDRAGGAVRILHVVHHHRGLPSAQTPSPRPKLAKLPRRPGSWSTASTRAKAHVKPSVPLDLGAAYLHQLEESQMLAAVRWRAGYDGAPPPLSRALDAADAFNRFLDGNVSACGTENLSSVEHQCVRDGAAAETMHDIPGSMGYQPLLHSQTPKGAHDSDWPPDKFVSRPREISQQGWWETEQLDGPRTPPPPFATPIKDYEQQTRQAPW